MKKKVAIDMKLSVGQMKSLLAVYGVHPNNKPPTPYASPKPKLLAQLKAAIRTIGENTGGST